MEKLVIIIWLLIAASLMGVAVYLALRGTEGWGWFLFVAVLMLGGVKISFKKEE